MDARIRLFVVGSQGAERSGAPRAHLACCGGAAWGWCLARRTTAGTATPLRAGPWADLSAQVVVFRSAASRVPQASPRDAGAPKSRLTGADPLVLGGIRGWGFTDVGGAVRRVATSRSRWWTDGRRATAVRCGPWSLPGSWRGWRLRSGSQSGAPAARSCRRGLAHGR